MATKRHRRRTNPEAAALPKRSHDLYYLFPGMGHGTRKRFFRNIVWSIIVGAFVSAGVAGILYLVYTP
jgi:hypothetical protein